MAFTNPGGYANEYQAMHPETTHQDFGDYNGPKPPKRKRIHNLIRRVLGKNNKQDQ
jgi:phosphatidylethanolamine-binding protein (PEBP) family uncharacterized protein